jgi:hypothetical protein
MPRELRIGLITLVVTVDLIALFVIVAPYYSTQTWWELRKVFAAFFFLLTLIGAFCIGFAAPPGSSGRTRRTRTGSPWWRARVDRAREARNRARRAAVAWEYYSRPGVGFGLWEVGVERALDTEVLEQQRTANLSPWDFRGILDAEGEAIALAWRYNDTQGVRS